MKIKQKITLKNVKCYFFPPPFYWVANAALQSDLRCLLAPPKPHKLPVLNKVKKTNESLALSTWNIRRGLSVRELELKKMLQDKNSDVMFLTETDTTAL